MNATMVKKIEVPGCAKTTVRRLHEESGLSILLVEVEPGGEIPLHTHTCAASMVVVSGSALTLGKNGRIVKKGDVVTKAALESHGFTNVNEQFSFISIADLDGILLSDGWDMEYI